jgi:hypothetical protein
VTDAELLVGVWYLEAEEPRTAEFHGDGTMTYRVDIGDRVLTMELTWHLDGGVIVSNPNEVRSRYRFADADTLVMEYGGETFTYKRR